MAMLWIPLVVFLPSLLSAAECDPAEAGALSCDNKNVQTSMLLQANVVHRRAQKKDLADETDDEHGVQDEQVGFDKDEVLGSIADAVKNLNEGTPQFGEAEDVLKGLAGGAGAKLDEAADILNKLSTEESPEDAEGHGELITTDLITTLTGIAGETMGCNPDNDEMCFEGDMEASSPDQLLLFQNARTAKKAGEKYVAAGRPWDEARVKYCFSTDVAQDIRHAFELATEQVQRAVPCISFVDVGNKHGANNDADTSKECNSAPAIFVQSKTTEGCWSYVGQLTPPIYTSRGQLKSQLLNLHPSGCRVIGTVIHELMHAMGMAHEQSRPDRDDYVQVHFENIKSGQAHNFNINQNGYTESTYDFLSVMHYGRTDFSSNGQPTITTIDGQHDGDLGNRMGLSQNDANQLAAMYVPVGNNCASNSLTGEKGCKDKDAICGMITRCEANMASLCCACGGGTAYNCYENQLCNQVERIPIESQADCIIDQTARFSGYECVVQNNCAYTVKVRCPTRVGSYWDYRGNSGCCQLPPWNEVCTTKDDCTFERV